MTPRIQPPPAESSYVTVGSPQSLPMYRIHRVQTRDIGHWLERGWADTCQAFAVSYLYGLIFVALGFAVTGGLLLLGLPYLISPLIGGFLLMGPLLAIGLLETSRSLEQGGKASLSGALLAFRRNPLHILIAGVILVLVMLVWVRVAVLIFAIAFPYIPPGVGEILIHTVTSVEGLFVLAAGTVIGAGFAAAAFVFGVVTLPLMLDQREDLFRAAMISFTAVRLNPKPMAIWAGVIVFFIGAGLVMAYVGLILTLPLIGHATWHAYRGLVTVDIPAPGQDPTSGSEWASP